MKIFLDHNPLISLAMQQNAVPTVHHLRVHNDGTEAVLDVRVELTIEGLSIPWEARLDRLDSDASQSWTAVDLRLSPEHLIAVQEALHTDLLVSLSNSAECLIQQPFPVEVLAYNQWSGLRGLPELLAAFLLPNHPAIQSILAQASALLVQSGSDGSLSGYQTRQPERVRLVAAAIYNALVKCGLAYVGVPASFEQNGQKIRTPDQVLHDRLANCLDMTCLIGAALEQSGLHPLLVLVEGHAFVGVWLEEESCAGSLIDDASLLRKSVDLRKLCLFEATGAVSGMPFEEAEKIVLARLDEKFQCAIDVHAARAMRIRPLPLRLSSDGKVTLVVESATPALEPVLPGVRAPRPIAQAPAAAPQEEWQRRFEPWKNRLLDLSLKNRLLAFRDSAKTVLPLLSPEPEALQQALNEGKVFTLRSRPRALQDGETRNLELAKKLSGCDLDRAEIAASLGRRELHVNLSQEETEARLLELYRSARTAMEETGAKIVYLAFGFLAWYETPQSEKPRLAPLVLVPIEVQRSSLREAFKLKVSDEEIRPNITLLQKLEREFRIPTQDLQELTEDEQGYDIVGYLQRVQAKILNVPRWEVRKDMVRLGIFSFSKLLMWLDLQLEGQDDLLRQILEGSGETRESLVSPRELDSTLKLSDSYCVVDADSSQMAAVYASVDGKSFVLQGPPGTGKSQTITNIIAQNMAMGRSVLFVAEKLAALQVVNKRLSDVGLSPFCLELHSNKASKTDIMRQLGEALNLAEQPPVHGWQAHTAELETLRQELNDYVRVLHCARPLGYTVFTATARVMQLEEVGVHISSAGESTREFYSGCRNALERLRFAAKAVGIPDDHVWRDSYLTEWDRSRQPGDEEALAAIAIKAACLREAADALCSRLSLDSQAALLDLPFLTAVAGLLGECPWPSRALLSESGWSDLKSKLAGWIAQGRRRQQLWKELADEFSAGLLQLDLAALLQSYQKWAGVAVLGFIMLWGSRRKLRKAARKALRKANLLVRALETAIEVQSLDGFFQERDSQLQLLLGQVWEQAQTDWDRVERNLDWVDRFRALLAGRQQRQLWLQVASQEEGYPASLFANFWHASSGFNLAVTALENRFKLQPKAWDFASATDWAARRCSQVGELKEWSHYRFQEQAARPLGMDALIDAHARGDVEGAKLLDTFERAYLERWLAEVYAQEPILKHFQGDHQRYKIAQFQKLDEQLLLLARQKVRSELASRVPQGQGTAQSEIAVLRKELKKQKRHKAPRALFREIRNLLGRLKPCILMSPLSVAQYLDPSLPPFDLVIFDEASQITPWDAAGVLRRAKQCIVVGDSKQLPPTSFFERTSGDDDLEEDEELLESILDECEGSGMPQLSLLWHYRSAHEHLITFSNRNYYEGRLLTFPGKGLSDSKFGIQFRYVEKGWFDRGLTRTNQAEAEAVVAELVARLRNPQENQRSYGVVTFNMTQQRLIEKLLEVQRGLYPEIEPYFTTSAETVFVKNLENVQGDERDVIIFSIAYGRDKQGVVRMNFGPLNQQGGQRRLNVAFSRARQQMVIFSSILARDIDLSRTQAEGVRDFKSFLAFAERGVQALDEGPLGGRRGENLAALLKPSSSYESPFEEQVGRALERKGWTIHKQVGCSSYRIDLGIVHPDHPGEYLAGVECDGATYHSAATARDRDRLREMVLRRMGWQIERIWSTEWFDNPRKELERIDGRLRELIAIGAPLATIEPPPIENEPADEMVMKPGLQPPLPYLQAQLPAAVGDSESIFLQAREVERILAILAAAEAPLTLERAVRKLAECWGIRRVGSRLRPYLETIVRRSRDVRIVKDVLWTCDPASYRGVRGGDFDDMPLAELANAVERVLHDSVAAPQADLIRGTARYLGLARVGKGIDARTQEAILQLVCEGRARMQGELVISV